MKYILNTTTIVNNNNFKSFVKFMDLPSCNNCIHFMEHKKRNIYETSNNAIYLSKCRIFGYKNIITGEIEHEFANKCRNSNDMCKISGIYFVQK
jgi:hypothetical protein